MNKQLLSTGIPGRFWAKLPELSDPSLRVYLHLLMHGEGERRVASLAKSLEKSERTIRRALQELRSIDLVRAYKIVDDENPKSAANIDKAPSDVGKPSTERKPLLAPPPTLENREPQPRTELPAKPDAARKNPPPARPPRSEFNKTLSRSGREGESEGERDPKANLKPVPFDPKSELDAMALEIAKAMNEETKLPMYRHYLDRYGKALIYRVYCEVKAIPSSQIRKSRAALFTHLIYKYAKKQDQNPRY